MYYIVESNQNYEAAVALCNKIVREINKGVILDKEDLISFKEIAERALAINKDIHKSVQDLENKRFGGHKGVCETLVSLIDERLKTVEEPEKLDFDKMSKEELIEYIKNKGFEPESKKEEENDLVFINPDEVEKVDKKQDD